MGTLGYLKRHLGMTKNHTHYLKVLRKELEREVKAFPKLRCSLKIKRGLLGEALYIHWYRKGEPQQEPVKLASSDEFAKIDSIPRAGNKYAITCSVKQEPVFQIVEAIEYYGPAGNNGWELNLHSFPVSDNQSHNDIVGWFGAAVAAL